MIRVLDSISAVNPAQAKPDGYTAILRYLVGNDPLLRPECEVYTANDFGIGSLFELNPDAAAHGSPQGYSDATLAVPAAQSLGQPKGTTIYYSVDVDPSTLPAGAGVDYFRGAAGYTHAHGYMMGAYVGAALANECLRAGVIERVMVPAASSWGDGQTPKREDVIQGYPYAIIAGSEYDPDIANPDTAGLWTLNGAWPRSAVAPPPPPPPPPTSSEDDAMYLIQVSDPQNGPGVFLNIEWLTLCGGKLAAITEPSLGALNSTLDAQHKIHGVTWAWLRGYAS